uniref:non-specific serine/threonine protein kinase n=1 Tax=Nothoprocta perdicaria TaxID=30464 RepID=A0A8C7EEF7_NOTPE
MRAGFISPCAFLLFVLWKKTVRLAAAPGHQGHGEAELWAPDSPALIEVTRALPAPQPGASALQLLKSADLGRQSLLYLKEIGHGWFGKVFLGEVNSGISSTQVVVKELKASASVQEQMQFLEEAQPYRALQHTNLLQCLAQCAEVTPYLLVMEFCPLGDLKGYLRSCRGADSMAPDPLTLQRMACEVACGVLHLHRNNYIHSDLALRNCLLTADLTVKIGDYGLSHCKYKDDYFVTADQLWVPLRWIAPELIDEVHGNLLIVDQTKSSNVWSLGVTIWELFELGNQPYDHYSDRQVLAYAIKEQQLKLPKPQLKLSLSERWYEVMQFCWLQPEQRPTAEEVHLLLSYLCAKGATEAEEEFEKRWNSMKPNGGGSGGGHPGAELSSFPLLEQFAADGFAADGDDVLTVMETSQGLNFEYKWEHPKSEPLQAPLGALSPGSAARYHELYYPAAAAGRLGLSPPCYACERAERPPEQSFPAAPAAGSGFGGFSSGFPERAEAAPALKSLQKQVGTPDSLESLDIPSTGSSCEGFSPTGCAAPGQPRALDSGYDTENNESPEFVLKEPHEPREPEGFVPGGQGAGPDAGTRLPTAPGAKSPCRDSAYFSDCDAEAERSPEDSAGGPGPGRVEEPPAPPPGPPWRVAGDKVEPDVCPSKTFFPSLVATGIEDKVAPGPDASHGVCGLEGSPDGAEQTVSPVPGAGHCEEPEEEEEDTEDSDESDEELRCYNVQEQSEESEEEPAAVPIVVAESHSARNLRSLLKMPSLLSDSFCEDLERKKKAVSFFDDVTIYLFDQESPTRELGEQSFPDGPGQPPGGPGSPAERVSTANGSVDGSGGFEWDDDFPLAPGKPSLMSSLAGTPAEPAPAVPALLPAQKQGLPLQLSRFTVSPAPVSRFSITHVSDSDMDSMGGECENTGLGGKGKEGKIYCS